MDGARSEGKHGPPCDLERRREVVEVPVLMVPVSVAS